MAIKWAYCGFGRMALKFHQSVKTIEEIEVVAVATKSKQDIAKEHVPKAKLYDSYEEMALDPNIDVVYISTTHNFHMDQVDLFAKNGKAVLCEKPMIIRKDQVSILERYRGKVLIMEAMWTRYLPAYLKAMELVNLGYIGKVRWFEASFTFDNIGLPAGRLQNKDLAGGALYDIGIYPLAIALDLANNKKPQEVKAIATLNDQKVDITTSVLCKWEDDFYANLFCSVDRRGTNEARIHGDLGTLTLSNFWMSQRINISRVDHVETIDIPFEVNGYAHIIKAFIEACHHKKLEVKKMTFDHSILLGSLMDEILNQVGYGS
jgi:predicted dehydrogenase